VWPLSPTFNTPTPLPRSMILFQKSFQLSKYVAISMIWYSYYSHLATIQQLMGSGSHTKWVWLRMLMISSSLRTLNALRWMRKNSRVKPALVLSMNQSTILRCGAKHRESTFVTRLLLILLGSWTCVGFWQLMRIKATFNTTKGSARSWGNGCKITLRLSWPVSRLLQVLLLKSTLW
jgi:hypothetical protein